jgi:sigma-B regulation protein RsbU (phosphoserine phosphatase)
LTLDKEYPMERFDKYFTMVYMVLNIRNGHLVYSNAAHPAPVLLNAKGHLEVLEEGGSMIGLGGSVPFFQGVVNLKSGDKIVIYSDGLIEYQNENGEFFGEEKFYEFLKRNINLPIDKLTDKLFDELSKFGNNAKLRDDVIFLTFMYKGIS